MTTHQGTRRDARRYGIYLNRWLYAKQRDRLAKEHDIYMDSNGNISFYKSDRSAVDAHKRLEGLAADGNEDALYLLRVLFLLRAL